MAIRTIRVQHPASQEQMILTTTEIGVLLRLLRYEDQVLELGTDLSAFSRYSLSFTQKQRSLERERNRIADVEACGRLLAIFLANYYSMYTFVDMGANAILNVQLIFVRNLSCSATSGSHSTYTWAKAAFVYFTRLQRVCKYDEVVSTNDVHSFRFKPQASFLITFVLYQRKFQFTQ